MFSKSKHLKNSILFYFLSIGILSFSQKKVLIYHETNGFRHNSIASGITMFEDLGNENNDWDTDNSQNSNVFNTSNLAQYDAVVFLNTSGDGLLSSSEKEALESFISSEKGFLGIHAATDTYRDKSWPFYNELVGAIVQTNPNHTVKNFIADMEVKASNPIIDFLGPVGSIWNKSEEYYYWELNGGQLSTDNSVLLEVESTGSNSYDAARPITWYKESITYDDDNNSVTTKVTLTGIKSFYTALGHNSSDYSSNSNFRTMLKNATLWAIGSITTLNISEQKAASNFKIINNPVKSKVQMSLNDFNEDFYVKVFNMTGKELFNERVKSSEISNNLYEFSIANYTNGFYLLNISTKSTTKSFKVLKI